MTDDGDCWDAFGSDGESDDDIGSSVAEKGASAIALHLSLFFLKQNAHIRLPERRVGLVAKDPGFVLTALEHRDITVVHLQEGATCSTPIDALIIVESVDKVAAELEDRLIPGGMLICERSVVVSQAFAEESKTNVYEEDETDFIGRVKMPIRAHSSICSWLPSSHSLELEEQRLQLATIAPSSSETLAGQLEESSIQRAVECMKKYGYCIIRNLLSPDQCQEHGKAVLRSVRAAAEILLQRDHVDIYNPHNSQAEPQSYCELSMREDLRLDLRYGPQLAELRSKGENGNDPVVVQAATSDFDGFLRGHRTLLEIIRQTMNPKHGDLYKGNIGRFNFDGTGADGSFQDLRVSPVGGIVSFPGAAEQAIHADTPHLFENIPDLPAHYINIFAPGAPFHEDVGGTAFFHGSHRLDFTAKYYGSDADNSKVYPFLVRPCLTLGDVVLFDCRILHFGLANASKSIERVLLYTNTTQAWFHDPKNWDDRKAIF